MAQTIEAAGSVESPAHRARSPGSGSIIGHSAVTARIVRSPAEARDAWRAIAARGCATHHAQTYEWYDAYDRSFGAGQTRWVIAVLERGGEIVGVLPLCTQSTRVFKVPVRALGFPEHPHLLLCDIAMRERLSATDVNLALRRALAQAGIGWDLILLRKILADSQAASLLAQSSAVAVEGRSAWFSCLEGYEAITAGFSTRLKKSLKLAQKRLRTESDIVIRQGVSGQDIDAAFAEFLQAEASGWKADRGSAIAQSADRCAFYELLAHGDNIAWRPEVNLLKLRGHTLAAQFCIRAGRTLRIIKIGYDQDYRELSPGNVLLNHVLKTSCEARDVDAISLITDMEWMKEWQTRYTQVLTLIQFNHTVAGLVARTLERVHRVRDRIRRSVSRSPA